MDLSLRFHHRRAKFEQSLFPKSKIYSENVLPINVPLGNDTSNTMFGDSLTSRLPEWMMQESNSRSNFVHKSCNDSDTSPCTSKFMIPRVTSATISISQQTIVGGFVGSKNYSGGSIFGEHLRICDVIIRKLAEFWGSNEGKPVHTQSPKSKFTSTSEINAKICDYSSKDFITSNKESGRNRISEKVSGLYRSSLNIPKSSNSVENVNESSESDLKKMKSLSSNICDIIESVSKEFSGKPSLSTSSTSREKYSSVVNGTCRNNMKCVSPESSSSETSPVHVKSVDTCVIDKPLPLKQSYAEVAKINPPKPLRPRDSVLIKNTQYTKKKNMLSKLNRYNNKGGSKLANMEVQDIIEDSDGFKSRGRLKRREFQRSPVIFRCVSSPGNESETENNFEVNFIISPKVESESGSCAEIVEKEPSKVGCRGRCPSESSVDSEDSFVVFAGSPESSSVSSSPYSTSCYNSSVELDEESDEESISSSDYSSSEDDESEDVVDFLSCSPAGNNILNCQRFKACSYTLPQKAPKEGKNKKVHFAEGSALAVVRPMIAWSFAYREARRGDWEVYSRDRARFQCRIKNLAPILNLVLDPKHRKEIFESRFVER